MDTTKANESGKTQQEDGTTAAESIFGSMTGKTPIQCRRMVDKFAQVLKFENEDNEGYADSNIPELHADGASFAGENACPADNADYSNGDEHGNKEDEKYEETLESVLNPEEPTAEELEMDRMFANKKYPTMQEISEASTPTVGMEFDSKDDAFFFFALYARRVGFAIKKDTSYESRKTNEITRQTFSCNSSVRVDSKVHEVSQVNVRIGQDSIHILQETRVPPGNIMKIFRKTRGSFRAVPFDTKNLENELAKERKKIKNRDIEELLLLFKEAREKMPGFRHSLDVDSDNRVKSIFWIDQIGRANYSKFGQFVSFDTTFSTNQYGMPFAPILGVDNYGKTVVFAVGLLEDERADTFKWLFEEFLSAMDNKHPKL
nr:protein FAR1-RELATED SEQUENCE 3-like [Lolium perenne]